MLIMKKEAVLSEIEKANAYLAKCLWMDFEFCRLDGFKVFMAGRIDQSYNECAINIYFEQPHFILSLLFWQSDSNKPFIQLCTDEETAEMSVRYRVEEGNYIFKINAEGFENPPIFIGAKNIACEIINTEPFSQN